MGLKRSWTREAGNAAGISDEQREERMRERFRSAIDENAKDKRRFDPVSGHFGGRQKDGTFPDYHFIDRIHGSKLMAALDQLSKEVACANKPLRDVFAEFDLDGDGTLDREEMKIGMANFGVSAKMWELDAIMRAFDEDGNGSVDYEEFAEMLENRAKSSEPMDQRRSFLRRSATAMADIFAGPKKGGSISTKGGAASSSGPNSGREALPHPGMLKVTSSSSAPRLNGPAKEVKIKGGRPETPDSGRNRSKPLQAGGMQMVGGAGDVPLIRTPLPPMVKTEAIKGKEDIEWLEAIMESIQRPKLRQALDKLATQMHDSRHSALTVFKEMDLNGDHILSRDEIGTGLRKLKVSLLPSELDGVIKLFDEDENGGVDYREFSALLARYARLIAPLPAHVRADAIRTANDMHWIETVLSRIHTPKLRTTLDRLSREIYGSTRSMHSFFVQFDLNGDGVLNAEEMHAGLTKMAGALQLSEVEALMCAFDADGNGEIDYKEFCSMLARYGRLTMPCEQERAKPLDELTVEFPVGCKVKALFNLPKAKSADDRIGTVTGVGKKGTLLVEFRSHEPMVVRSTQIKKVDATGGESQNVRAYSHKSQRGL
jgi:Ca2+-binding EF-hand superfamily protein